MAGNGDTIFSLSSAPGKAGISVFRISGDQTASLLERLTQKALPEPRRAVLRKIYDSDQLIDEGLILWIPGPQSFTGEDCAEYHGHGSLSVIEGFTASCIKSGVRQAEPGEFTKRAVLNGRMDLTEAEGLADLIDSETEGQRLQALKQMGGGLKVQYEDWREALTDALAMIEGEIDFPDEGDVPEALAHKAGPILETVKSLMQNRLDEADRGERVRSGLDIAIIGAPNAGKSSFINALAERDVAITSDEAGTTRDIVEVQMNLGGLPVRLSDTAGLRAAESKVEAEGVRRAKVRAEESDIRILVHDVTGGEVQFELLSELRRGDILLLNKIDRMPDQKITAEVTEGIPIFQTSILKGEGITEVKDWLEAEVIDRFSPSNLPGLTQQRHIDCVFRAVKSIERAQDNLVIAPELSGDDLRQSLQALAELAGQVDIEAVFDRIFSRFCIGK